MAVGRYVIIPGFIGDDLILGRNLHKVIMASYRWLSDNYQDGDRIFLFGEIFSSYGATHFSHPFQAIRVVLIKFERWRV
jgi:uncharacterized protein (DUF2235 family)